MKTDQTGWMPRLIRVFPGCQAILLILSCSGSFPTEIINHAISILVLCFMLHASSRNEPQHDETNKMTGNPPSLIRVFTVHSVGS